MERRLKADIVADARNKGGCFDIFREVLLPFPEEKLNIHARAMT